METKQNVAWFPKWHWNKLMSLLALSWEFKDLRPMDIGCEYRAEAEILSPRPRWFPQKKSYSDFVKLRGCPGLLSSINIRTERKHARQPTVICIYQSPDWNPVKSSDKKALQHLAGPLPQYSPSFCPLACMVRESSSSKFRGYSDNEIEELQLYLWSP